MTAATVAGTATPAHLMFFGALFVQFAPSAATPATYAGIASVMVGTAAVWFFGIARMASHPAVVARLMRSATLVDAVACAVFVLIGTVMVAQAIHSLT